MNVRKLLQKTRSYRRFIQDEKIETQVLKAWVENIRFTPSPANLQPLKFVLVNNEDINDRIFPHLKWAAYLENWEGPSDGERPSAYIVMLGNRKISLYIDWDYGIALQTILLSAAEKGVGGCAIASCNKKKIKEILAIPDEYEIGCVIALGKPGETVVIDTVTHGDIKYRRDEQDVHHVPKRSLEELIYKVIE
ncbi:MAG: nitroreductase family protein [Candidatus Aminicenantes bacterium]|nr:nitroreductase family protein [Candidatus Aminicenantes bacterium]